MPRREFLQLAHTYDAAKHKIAGWYVSEKLDGTRAFWDGGLSRGQPTKLIPWASVIDPKTKKPKDKVKPVATGLWSRYGNPIMAPDWFLDSLPPIFLDGELWAGRGNFQLCRSICAGDAPDPRFNKIQYRLYSSPPLSCFCAEGEVKNTNMVCAFDKGVASFIDRRAGSVGRFDYQMEGDFSNELLFLREHVHETTNLVVHHQFLLPPDEEEARNDLEGFLTNALDKGGEGVVIRDSQAPWTPKRTKSLLKYKPFQDAEAVITGFTSGRETTKGSKHLGRIGALITEFNGNRLELAGLTDAEREFLNGDMVTTAKANPGQDMPGHFKGRHFRKGQTITFKFRELTDVGVPKEARFWRRSEAE
jgi:DNA ligase-1